MQMYVSFTAAAKQFPWIFFSWLEAFSKESDEAENGVENSGSSEKRCSEHFCAHRNVFTSVASKSGVEKDDQVAIVSPSERDEPRDTAKSPEQLDSSLSRSSPSTETFPSTFPSQSVPPCDLKAEESLGAGVEESFMVPSSFGPDVQPDVFVTSSASREEPLMFTSPIATTKAKTLKVRQQIPIAYDSHCSSGNFLPSPFKVGIFHL